MYRSCCAWHFCAEIPLVQRNFIFSRDKRWASRRPSPSCNVSQTSCQMSLTLKTQRHRQRRRTKRQTMTAAEKDTVANKTFPIIFFSCYPFQFFVVLILYYMTKRMVGGSVGRLVVTCLTWNVIPLSLILRNCAASRDEKRWE